MIQLKEPITNALNDHLANPVRGKHKLIQQIQVRFAELALHGEPPYV
ncbi:MAG: hypothetical protein AB7D06_18120 [Pedobacter sp.]